MELKLGQEFIFAGAEHTISSINIEDWEVITNITNSPVVDNNCVWDIEAVKMVMNDQKKYR